MIMHAFVASHSLNYAFLADDVKLSCCVAVWSKIPLQLMWRKTNGTNVADAA